MENSSNFKTTMKLLRTKALARLSRPSSNITDNGGKEEQRLIEDLRVHQIELEIQNEELRNAQHALEQSRDRYLALFHFAPVGYVVTDATGIIKKVNQTLALMIGKDISEMLDMPFGNWVHPNDQDVFYSRFRAYYNNPAKKNFEIQLLSDDRSDLYVKLDGYRIGSEDGHSIDPAGNGLLLIGISDITRAKKAQQAIVTAKRQWEQTFDAVPDLIAIIDEHNTIVRVNQALARRLGKRPQECVGKKCYSMLHADLAQPENCPHRQFFLSGKTHEIEAYSRTLNGHFITSVSPFQQDQDAAPWCIHVSRDITQRKQAEREIRRARNLESIGTFAGGLAHDFNNLLAALVGHIELTKINGADPIKVNQHADQSMTIVMRIRDLANRLLTFATGGEPLPQSIAVRNLLEKAAYGVFQADFNRVRLNLPADLQPIIADEVQMISALQSVMENALEAMPDGGEVVVDARNISVSSSEKNSLPLGDYVRLTIRDHGQGIAPQNLGKVFDPYFSTKEMGVQKGMGLGLAITHSIITKHKGHIRLTSHPGEGTSVSIFLPVESSP